GVTIIGAVNLASTVPFHASQLYSRNVANFLSLLFKEGQLNLEDEIPRSTLVCHQGEVVHPRVKESLSTSQSDPAKQSDTPNSTGGEPNA
ncbi:MAG: NAD(P)(+) transhydrogenase (Re/Si-specific) subunit alpha, partial [Armatimonadetes bacterium]|nr:NAD(P)(+) transhydrogenase (Re/Si-specific) subunit alpha [Armatimonadota bacterium]